MSTKPKGKAVATAAATTTQTDANVHTRTAQITVTKTQRGVGQKIVTQRPAASVIESSDSPSLERSLNPKALDVIQCIDVLASLRSTFYERCVSAADVRLEKFRQRGQMREATSIAVGISSSSSSGSVGKGIERIQPSTSAFLEKYIELGNGIIENCNTLLYNCTLDDSLYDANTLTSDSDADSDEPAPKVSAPSWDLHELIGFDCSIAAVTNHVSSVLNHTSDMVRRLIAPVMVDQPTPEHVYFEAKGDSNVAECIAYLCNHLNRNTNFIYDMLTNIDNGSEFQDCDPA